jgi:hypothetical protein
MPAYQHKSLSMVTKLRRERGFAYRIAVTFVALLAFTLQSYVTQTHIHLEAQPNLGFSISKDAASDTASKATPTQNREHDRYPPGDDPAHCPFCQEMLYAGCFLAPAPVAVFQLTFSVILVAIVREISVALSPVSHTWRGRGPPLA